MSGNIFSEESSNDPQEVDGAAALAELVGEGKKYASIEELAKAKVFADRHIKNIEAEQEQLRKDLSTRVSVDEALQRAQQKQTQQPKVTPEAPAASHQTPAKPTSDEELVAQFKRIMQEERSRETSEANLTQSIDKLIEVYGDDKTARKAIQDRARELGVGAKFLQDAASSSPRAFQQLMGLEGSESRKSGVPAATRSDVNVDALANQQTKRALKPGTYAFYENMRKENPKLYYAPATQNRMHREALAAGDAFYA